MGVSFSWQGRIEVKNIHPHQSNGFCMSSQKSRWPQTTIIWGLSLSLSLFAKGSNTETHNSIQGSLCVCVLSMLCISYRRDRAAGPFFFFIITCFFFLCAILAITLVFVSRFVFIRMVGRGKEMDEKWCGETYIFPKMGEGRSIMQDGCRVA